jgi:hypothetical protein
MKNNFTNKTMTKDSLEEEILKEFDEEFGPNAFDSKNAIETYSAQRKWLSLALKRTREVEREKYQKKVKKIKEESYRAIMAWYELGKNEVGRKVLDSLGLTNTDIELDQIKQNINKL